MVDGSILKFTVVLSMEDEVEENRKVLRLVETRKADNLNRWIHCKKPKDTLAQWAKVNV